MYTQKATFAHNVQRQRHLSSPADTKTMRQCHAPEQELEHIDTAHHPPCRLLRQFFYPYKMRICGIVSKHRPPPSDIHRFNIHLLVCVFLLVYRVKSIWYSLLAQPLVSWFGASCLEGRSGRNNSVLLLHELFAGSFDGNGEAELGGVL